MLVNVSIVWVCGALTATLMSCVWLGHKMVLRSEGKIRCTRFVYCSNCDKKAIPNTEWRSDETP